MSSLVERLAGHRALGSSPPAELEWVAAHGTLRSYKAGDVMGEEGAPIVEMMVIFTGRGALYLEKGSGRRKAFEWHGGDITGALPFSRAMKFPASARRPAWGATPLTRQYVFDVTSTDSP